MPTPPTAGVPVLTDLAGRVTHLAGLLGMVAPVPEPWLNGATSGPMVADPNASLDCLECTDYRTLVLAWRKAMKWTEGLDRALSVMLASVLSTKSVGDQLWVKILGPPSCGKSTLCEAISVARDYVLAKSTVRGFHSGYKSDDGSDVSLISQINGKTLVTKDGDTLLQSPNLGQILSEARDVYDGTSRTSYRNDQSREYMGVKMTWLLCGTNSLREIDTSELGQRFLDCIIMEGIDPDLEDEINKRVAHRAARNLAIESNNEVSTNYEPELLLAMRLTGGYVNYLRENANELLSQVVYPSKYLDRCGALGTFVAHARARPGKEGENVDREFSPRLTSQHVRLMGCLTVVMNKTTVDEEVMRRVVKVSCDTAQGPSLTIMHHLMKSPYGMATGPLAMLCNQTEDKTRKLVRYLRHINAVELSTVPAPNGVKSNQQRWQLTPRMARLYKALIDADASEAEDEED